MRARDTVLTMYPAYPVRASDAEREATVAMLHTATTEGRLSLVEFSERSQRAYAALTQPELAALVADLPVFHAPPPHPPGIPPTAKTDQTSLLALIFGILALPAITFLPLGALAGVGGIVCGVKTLRRARRGLPANRGWGLVGVIGGAIGLAGQVALPLLGFFLVT